MSANIDLNRLQENLQTKCLGRKIFFTNSVSSTNDWAKKLAALGANEGTVTIAQKQTKGRGRLEREWISPKGGLWFSLILRPRTPAKNGTALVFVASLAVAETLSKCYGLEVQTKWPNDILVKGRKICGILTEINTTNRKINFAIVGIGLNANFPREALPENLEKTVTTLEEELGRKIKIEELFKALVWKLEILYDLFLNQGSISIIQRWKNYASFLGRHVEVKNRSERFGGIALDVNEDGVLILKLANGMTKGISVGDITVHRA